MLYLKPANFDDIEKEYAFVAAEPADENGLQTIFLKFRLKTLRRLPCPA